MHKILFRVLNWYPCAYNSKALSVAQGQNGCLARTRPCTGSRHRTENETEHNKAPFPSASSLITLYHKLAIPISNHCDLWIFRQTLAYNLVFLC